MYGARTGEALYYHIYPNFMLNILPGRLQTNLVIPTAHDRCTVVFRYYYTETESAAARKLIADDLAYSESVQREDIEICERVQTGLSSRAYDRIHRLNPGLGPPPHRLVPGTVLVLPRPEAGGPDARLTAAPVFQR